MRFLTLEDLFEVKCKKCNSNDVSLYASHCDECGDIISGECNNCHSKYDYHDFKRIDENTKKIFNAEGKEEK